MDDNMKISFKKVIPLIVILAVLAVFSGFLIKNKNILQNASPCNVNCIPVFTNITSTNVTDVEATITWNTDIPSSSAVVYTSSTGTITTQVDTNLVIFHSVTLTNLDSSTLYQYHPISDTVTASNTDSFTTTAFVPIVISNVQISNIYQSGATITWETNKATDSMVKYGITSQYSSSTVLDPIKVKLHTVQLSGLNPSTLYHFKPKSGTAPYVDGKFTTTPIDTTKPSVSFASPPAGGATLSGVVTFNINATDNVFVTKVEFYSGNNILNTSTQAPYLFILDTNIIPNGPITLMAKAYDWAGNVKSTSKNFTIFNQVSVPLPIISAIGATQITLTSALIVWHSDTASSSQVEYGLTNLYGSTTVLDSNPTKVHSVLVSGLTPGTQYHYRIKSGNLAGMAISNDKKFITAFGTIPVISNLANSNLTPLSVTITWTTNTGTDSQVEYGTTSSYGTSTPIDSNLSTSHTVVINGLSPETKYYYKAKSSVSGTTVYKIGTSFTTPPLGNPPTISSVASINVTSSAIDISWSTNKLSDSQVEYGTTTSYGYTTTIDPTMATSHLVHITGLSNKTVYHYRVKSTNIAGTTFSTDKTFTTIPGAVGYPASLFGVNLGLMSNYVNLNTGTILPGAQKALDQLKVDGITNLNLMELCVRNGMSGFPNKIVNTISELINQGFDVVANLNGQCFVNGSGDPLTDFVYRYFPSSTSSGGDMVPGTDDDNPNSVNGPFGVDWAMQRFNTLLTALQAEGLLNGGHLKWQFFNEPNGTDFWWGTYNEFETLLAAELNEIKKPQFMVPSSDIYVGDISSKVMRDGLGNTDPVKLQYFNWALNFLNNPVVSGTRFSMNYYPRTSTNASLRQTPQDIKLPNPYPHSIIAEMNTSSGMGNSQHYLYQDEGAFVQDVAEIAKYAQMNLFDRVYLWTLYDNTTGGVPAPNGTIPLRLFKGEASNDGCATWEYKEFVTKILKKTFTTQSGCTAPVIHDNF
jgi:hypothetical protein